MDIDYLLFLQNFREATNNFFSPFLLWLTKFAVSAWPIAMAAMVYWAFDRKAGKRILAGFAMGTMLNGILKLTFRITRPWLRDSRVEPYGDSKVSATGFSFPSGHATNATASLGGVAWWARKRYKVLAIVLCVAVVLIYFSRNYLGVHTPQDVAVGAVATMIMMFCAAKIEDWTDADPKRDWIVLAAGLVLCIVCALYYQTIHIEAVYDEAGTLVVDPAKMVADSYDGIGFLSGYVICRIIDRRCFHFDTEKSWKDRFIIGVFGIIPLYWWINTGSAYIVKINRSLGKFTKYFGMVIIIMLIVPFVMSKIHLSSEKPTENTKS